MICANKYSQVLDEWKIELIEKRAGRFGLRGPDLDDAVQDIVLNMLEFDYDAERAAERTALAAVIDNRLKMFHRGQARYAGMLGRLRESEPEQSYRSERETQLAMDVGAACEGMSDEEKAVCRGLSEGKTPFQIARERGCHRSRIERIIGRIRKEFQQRDLQAWLVGKGA